MNKQEAEEYAKTMTYRDAVYNLTQAKCIPYRKATLIKVYELLDLLEPKARGWKVDTLIFDEEVLMTIPKEMLFKAESEERNGRRRIDC